MSARYSEVRAIFTILNNESVINLIFFLLTCLGLIFLFTQYRIYLKQKHLIKIESKALKKLQKKNISFLFHKSLSNNNTSLAESFIKSKPKVFFPRVRNFEFPKHLKRKAEKSMVRN